MRYIDNVSALSGFVRGGCKAPDVDRAAAVVAIVSALLGCRVWFEYVESDANWSDSLSRSLGECTWCSANHFALRQVAVPSWPWSMDWDQLPAVLKAEVEQRWSCGGAAVECCQ